MTSMPVWYLELRSSLMLLQSIAGFLLFAPVLTRRSFFFLRLVSGTLAGMWILRFLGPRIYMAGSTPAALLSHALTAILVYVFLILIAWLCYGEPIWTLLFTAASGYIAQDIAGSVKTLVRLIPWVDQLTRLGQGVLFVDLICYGAVYLVLFLLLRPFVKTREGNFDNKIKALFSVGVLLLCVAMARLTQDNPQRNSWTVIGESFLQIVIDIMVIALQFGVMEQARLSSHVETMRELVHQQRAQYEASKESAQLINEKYHDLKHLLKSFRGTVPQEQLDKLKQSIAAYERPANSGNEVLDVLLAEKIGICQQRGIVLTCNLGQTDFSFVEELDLYSLFQNALNNAVQAVSDLPPGTERFISLSATRDGNMLSIHMENPCQPDIPFSEGLPQTSGDPDWHGFGMKSMVRTAEKYSGTLTAEVRGTLFLLDILLLAPDES